MRHYTIEDWEYGEYNVKSTKRNPMKEWIKAIKEVPWDNVLLFVTALFCAIVFSFFIVILLMGLK
jgi:hypothetical protein